MTAKEKIEQLHKEFIREYPGFGKRVGIKHICKFFGISRNSLYYAQSKNPNSKLNSIDRSQRSNEKFLTFLFNNFKKSGK